MGRVPTSVELERLPWLQINDQVLGETQLPPCRRAGGAGDWWREQHRYCTGGEHRGPGLVVICSCECHVGREHLILPSPVSGVGGSKDG